MRDFARRWLADLRRGLARPLPADRLGARDGPAAGAWGNLRLLEPFLRRHWRRGALGAALPLAGPLLSFPQPLVTRYLVDDVILGRQLDRLPAVIVVLGGLTAAGMLAGVVHSYFSTRLEQDVGLDIQQHLLRRTLHLPKSFLDQNEVGYLMSRLWSDASGLRWFFSGSAANILGSALRFAGGVGFLLYLEWRLALASLVVLPGLVLWSRFFSRRFRALSHHSLERQARVTRRLQESLSSATLIKAFASEERETDRVRDEAVAAQQVSLERVAVGSMAGVSMSVLHGAANLLVLGGGAYLVITGQWTLGSLLAFRSYLGYVYGPAQGLAAAALQIQGALAALDRVAALCDVVPEETGTGTVVERLRGEVELRDVAFAYGGDEVLGGISCRIAAGEHVAIVGPSGVGKTTLVSLLLRFYKPTRGEVWFDGRPAAEYELGSLRRRIGYVAQQTTLLSGTILDNLRYGAPEASLEQAVAAARVAGIHEFVAGLPEGYGSSTGEKGVNLSEGQRQRLSIARALVKAPDVLILDEPTAALDSITERSIWDTLPAAVRGRTLFVVAHRLATAQNADRILLLHEGRLAAVGTHAELLAGSDLYRTLVANQQIVAAS